MGVDFGLEYFFGTKIVWGPLAKLMQGWFLVQASSEAVAGAAALATAALLVGPYPSSSQGQSLYTEGRFTIGGA